MRKDEEALANLYRSNGFRGVKVTSTVQPNFNGKENDLGVVYHIQEGPQWKVSSLKIEGTNQPQARFHCQGLILRRRSALCGRQRGHRPKPHPGVLLLQRIPNATFRYQVDTNDDDSTVNLVYQVSEGAREFVRKVIVTGLDITHYSLIDKSITLKEGEPLSMTRVNDISRKLSDLGVFSNVGAALQDADGRSQYKYVLYDVDEANRYTFNVGLGLEIGQFGGTTNNLSQAGGAKAHRPSFPSMSIASTF